MSLLGLDLSTQSLTCLLLSLNTGELLHREEVSYDTDLPHYRTTAGVRVEGSTVWSDPRMWLEAVDLALGRMREKGVRLGDVEAVSGAAQQHGTVYLDHSFLSVISTPSTKSWQLVERLNSSFSTARSPVWMDSSTSTECQEITTAVGGSERIESITGSSLYERFPAAQIRKMWKNDQERYDNSALILVISSFMSTVFSDGRGGVFIDECDASGTGLMCITSHQWSPILLSATAPNLLSKLPTIVPSGTPLSLINPYFTSTYGFSPNCKAVVWSGDNPCSALALGLFAPGKIGVSFGSSDTLFASTATIPQGRTGEKTTFLTPAGTYLPIIVVKNGASARLSAKESAGIQSWSEFDRTAQVPSPGVVLFFTKPEITPKVPSPTYREIGCNSENNIRALLDSQVLNLHYAAEMLQITVTEVGVTGGAAECRSLRAMLSDVFGAPVHKPAVNDTAALGAAMCAAYALHQPSLSHNWQSVVQRLLSAGGEVTRPDHTFAAYYQEKISLFRKAVEEVITAI